MDETNTSTTSSAIVSSSTTRCNNFISSNINTSCDSRGNSIVSIISNPGAGNMETKGTNIPTNAHQQHQNNNANSNDGSCSRGSAEVTAPPPTTSDQSNNTTKTREASEESSKSGGPPPLAPPGAAPVGKLCSNNLESEGIACRKNGGKTGEPDIVGGRKGSSSDDEARQCCGASSSNISQSCIDPGKESTTTTLVCSDGRKQELSCQGISVADNNSCSEAGITNNHKKIVPGELTVSVDSLKVLATADVGDDENSSSSCAKSDPNKTPTPGVSTEACCELVADSSNKGATLSNSCNGGSVSNGSTPPVPNFRVEGSGAGDSSITVAVASLSSAVSSSITLHSSGRGGGGSTGGTNSLENGEQPGSSSGPVSIQSSEEMRLSLVSWYSEPDDPSRIIEGCCSALNTFRQEEGSNGEDIISHSHVCDSSNSMGHEAISVANSSSPACKSESEEKENKTPEPCVNHDKLSGMVGDKNGTTDTISKSEFIDTYKTVPSEKKSSATVKSDTSTNNKTSFSVMDDQQNCHTQQGKSAVGEPCCRSNVRASRDRSAHESGKSAKSTSTPPQKTRAHVQVTDHKQSCSGGSSSHHGSGGGHTSRCQQDSGNKSSKPECPRCSRRSKSGTTTPASGNQVAKTRTPASRRVVQSSKSSTEIKKPIKSILKHDSRGSAGSGSGSDKQSSMDSLGSSGDIGVTPVHILRGRMSNALMTRSDSGTRARFNFNSSSIHGPPDTPTGVPEDKAVSKLKRIEKYATLRIRKSIKARPLDLSDSETHPNDTSHSSSGGNKVGAPGVPNEIMSKSMSYLEKSSSNRVHISSAQGHPYGESTSASSTLKRQGSLRVKKHSTPQWEPSGTRTSALRLQKMQEAKAKNSPGAGVSSGSANSGSAHSGSGDSLHYLPHSANSTSTSAGSSGMSSIHITGSHSAPAAHGRMSAATVAAKEKHMGAKIFSKLSSALGQTASSNQKRIRQERGVQTDVLSSVTAAVGDLGASGRASLSPVPAIDLGSENVEQIKNLERLCNRYRNQFIKAQSEYEKSESRKVELLKQLEETQHESTEMIEFLQAEKSTLAESLTEIEIEV